MALSGDINDMNTKTKFFDFGFIGDASSDFVFEHFFKLNFSETIECTNMKLVTINHHSEVSIIWV